jgi:hypothetical protein
MEAVVALGIAGNAVQFLDFATKLCAASTEIYRDASGASAANKQSQTLVRNFVEKIDEISKDVGLYFDALATASSQASAQADPQISLIIKDCQVIAQDLSTRLAKLKASGTHGRWKSFLKGLECMWKKNELDELEGRLKRNRSELEWRILLSMRLSRSVSPLEIALTDKQGRPKSTCISARRSISRSSSIDGCDVK